jgi:cytochrome c oxidase assembly factor CtaG
MLSISSAPPPITWNFAPSILVMILSQAVLYGYLVTIARKDGHWGTEVRASHVVYFASGLVIIFIALVSPIDALSNVALFAAHMVQHILLMLLASVFLVLGTPGYWLRFLYDLPVLKKVLPIVTHPLATLIAFNLVMWLWHIPALYESALRDPNVHIVEHLMFLVFGVLLWLPIVHDVPPHHSLSYPARMAYLFACMISSSILGAIFTFAPTVSYPFYGDAPQWFGISPMTDQQLAGLIMWIPGAGIFFVAILVVFGAWLKAEDRKARAQYPPPPYVQ